MAQGKSNHYLKGALWTAIGVAGGILLYNLVSKNLMGSEEDTTI
tara:strand:- start:411 stop:542 length:132 start_codon:yes stop_codon:yes gene_type:complete